MANDIIDLYGGTDEEEEGHDGEADEEEKEEEGHDGGDVLEVDEEMD